LGYACGAEDSITPWGVLRGERKKQEELKEMLQAEEGGDFSRLASIVKAVTVH